MTPLRRVLHVEDDPAIRAIARVALETVGQLELLSCASGAEALALAPGFAPDLILLDVMMPGQDGPSTLAALRERMPLERTAVVFMTAKVQSHELDHYRALGAVGIVTKPFDPMRLAADLSGHWTAFHDHRAD